MEMLTGVLRGEALRQALPRFLGNAPVEISTKFIAGVGSEHFAKQEKISQA